MMAVGKWGAFLQPSPKWSLIAVEKCVEMQKPEEMMVAVREKPQSSKTPGAESSGQRCGCRERTSDGVVRSHWESRADFHVPERSR